MNHSIWITISLVTDVRSTRVYAAEPVDLLLMFVSFHFLVFNSFYFVCLSFFSDFQLIVRPIKGIYLSNLKNTDELNESEVKP